MNKNDGLKTGIIICIITLSVISVTFVFSSSFTKTLSENQNTAYFAIRQIIWFILGGIGMFILSKFDYRNYKQLGIPFFFIGLILLIWVLGFGVTVKGAKRWVRIFGFTFQPAEFAKLFFVIFLAGKLNQLQLKSKKDLDVFFPIVMISGIYLALIYLERDLSSTIHLAVVILIMTIVSNIKLRYIFSLIFLISGFGALFIRTSENRWGRVIDFIDGIQRYGVGGGYQAIQSVIGVGNGGLFGTGIAQGMQKYYYLPEGHTDYIFSIIAEEAGFFGAVFVIALYLALLIIGIKTFNRTHDYFGKQLALGITSLITVQAIINIMVVIGLFPATGIPLPIISTGGSSLIMLMFSLGILINIIKGRAKL